MTTSATPLIQKTPNVCGGSACIGDWRITVWMLVLARKLGSSDADLLESFPGLTEQDLDACWNFYRDHPVEIEQEIWLNDTAADVPDGVPPPASVLVAGLLLGISNDEIREAFDPPLTDSDLAAAWQAYRADMARISQEISQRQLAG